MPVRLLDGGFHKDADGQCLWETADYYSERMQSFRRDGKRVKKYVPASGETTVFVYDAAGKLVAEYSTIVADTSTAKVAYFTNDHLGSPRINTDANGAVTSRHDYHPFGEEIDGTGGRTTGLNYGDDSVRKQFTGYERDNESELDFAEARYYNSKHGRFTTVDPLMASAKVTRPESWNRYVYCYNNPLRFIDPDGMDVQVLDEKAQETLLKTLPKKIRDKVKAQIDKDGKLKKGALDKIKSKDQNFKDLKTMVDAKDLTEVATGTEALGVKFFERTGAENKEKDIQNYMQLNPGISKADAEKALVALGVTWGYENYLGYTLNPSESPSGNLRIVVTDRTGEASTVSKEAAVMTMGHELYGHGLLYRQGKPYGHGQGPSEAFFEAIEKRTQTNYQRGEQKANTPKNVKPKQ